jgi:hypothetical protein
MQGKSNCSIEVSESQTYTWTPNPTQGLYCPGALSHPMDTCTSSLAEAGDFSSCPRAATRHLLVVARCYPDAVTIHGATYDRHSLIQGLAYLDALAMLIWILSIAFLAYKER